MYSGMAHVYKLLTITLDFSLSDQLHETVSEV